MSLRKRLLMLPLVLLFVSAGVAHFTDEAFFTAIVPDWLPAPRLLVWVSGVAEILGGLGLLLPQTRRLAAWGLIALLIAVFPANIDMALDPQPIASAPAWMGLDDPNPVALWLRLPVQFLFIGWTWLYTREAAE